MRAETPKNGPRQEIEPRTPPMSGPAAMPRPSAASYSTIAWPTDPFAALTMVARAVAMNRALPSPQTARNPMMPPTVSEVPARPAPMMMMVRPMSSVRLAPRRLDTAPVTSIASPITTM